MTEDKAKTEPDIEMICQWVEFDEFGETKKCIEPEAWDNIMETHQILSFQERCAIFNKSYCKYCLEGQKIEIANNVLSAFYEGIGTTSYLKRIVQSVLDKLKLY